MPPPPTGPLHGVRVLDLTSVVLGPLATQILGDYGAEVTKIETLDGDRIRANGVSKHAGMSSIFLAINRNKLSLAIDLKTPRGREILLRLASRCDVLIHNMRVSAMERLGLGYDAVRAVNPGIVYCAATGFDQDGPDRDKPAFDDIIQAASGMASLMGQLADTPAGAPAGAPDYVPALMADKTVGMAVVNAVLAAMFHRERSGQGQYIEVPMLETMVEFTMAEHMGGLAFDPPTAAAGYARIVSGGRRPAPTADGHIAMLPYSPEQWARIFHAAGHDEQWQSYGIGNRQQLNTMVRTLYRALDTLTPHKTTAQWVALCEQLDIPATPIYELDDLPRHPQLQAVGLFQRAEHPTEGAVRFVRPATKFSATPASVRTLAPRLGQDTVAILAAAGYSDAEVTQLRRDGVVASDVSAPAPGDRP